MGTSGWNVGRLTAVALVAVVALAGCSKSSSNTPSPSSAASTPEATLPQTAVATSPAAAVDLSGSWTGTWQRVEIAGKGPMDLTVQEQGTTLSGSRRSPASSPGPRSPAWPP